MKIAVIVAAVGAVLYVIYHAITTPAKQTSPIVTSKFTPNPVQIPNYFGNPSPIIQNGSLPTLGMKRSLVTTGPTYAQAGIQPDLPLTPASPSLLVPLNGDPAVTPASDINPGLDYPGLQSYMDNPDAADPNAPLPVYT